MVRLEQAQGGAGSGVGCGWFLNSERQGGLTARGSPWVSSHLAMRPPSSRVWLSALVYGPCPWLLPAGALQQVQLRLRAAPCWRRAGIARGHGRTERLRFSLGLEC